MTDQDEQAFIGLMTAMCHTYGKPYDSLMAELYFNTLKTYPFEAIGQAFYRHIEDPDKGQFWPKPADIIRHLQGGRGTQALAAWDAALKAIGEHGSYRTVKFDDRLINAVIDRMGGWVAFCSMSDDWTDEEGEFHRGDKPFRQKEFIERYQAYITHPPTDIPASLAGRSEMANRISKYASDERALETYRPTAIGPERVRPAISWQEPDALPSGNGRPSVRRSLPPGMSSIGSSLSTAAESGFDEEKFKRVRDEMEQRERERQEKAVGEVDPEPGETP